MEHKKHKTHKCIDLCAFCASCGFCPFLFESRETQSGILPSGKPEFERLEHVPSIGIRRLVISIVKQNNVSRMNPAQSCLHGRSRLRSPVAPIHRPHHHIGQSSLSDRRKKLRTSETKGWPDAAGSFTGRC